MVSVTLVDKLGKDEDVRVDKLLTDFRRADVLSMMLVWNIGNGRGDLDQTLPLLGLRLPKWYYWFKALRYRCVALVLPLSQLPSRSGDHVHSDENLKI